MSCQPVSECVVCADHLGGKEDLSIGGDADRAEVVHRHGALDSAHTRDQLALLEFKASASPGHTVVPISTIGYGKY